MPLRPTVQLATTAVVAALVCSPDLRAQELIRRSERVVTISEAIAAGGTLGLFTPNGRIAVVPATGDRVELRAEKEVRYAEYEDIAFQVIRSSGGLTICAVFDQDDECTEKGVRSSGSRRWTRTRRMSVDLTAHIPRGIKLHAGTGNGEVSVEGVGGETRVSTGNGRMRISGVSGPVEASTGNGDISVRATRGPVNASSGNGDIDVTMNELRLDGDMEFSSGNGSIRVAVPEGFSADVIADTGNGHFSTDFPITLDGRGRFREGHVRGTIGGGGRRVRMSSGNGRLELRRAS